MRARIALLKYAVELYFPSHLNWQCSTVQIWDLKSYKLKTDLPGHTDEVYCVDFVADKVVSGGRDRTVKMWESFIFSNRHTDSLL